MKALVIGAARSGIGAANLLLKNGYEVTLVSRDDFVERETLEKKGIKVILNDHYHEAYDAMDLVVKNPGISNDHPLVSKMKNIMTEIDIAARFNPHGKYYAISGTNGKTTTTELLYKMLETLDEKALLAGNIGIALSQKIYEIGDVKQNVALELSSFQMEHLPSFSPEVYALMNLTPDHLDRYVDEDEYYKVKTKLGLKAKVFIRNADDKNIMRLTNNFKGEIYDLSLNSKKDIYIEDDKAYFRDAFLFDVQDVHLKAKHNLYNALFASSMAHLAGVTQSDIQHVLNTFTGVKHRLEFIVEKEGVLYYNDSKATNPEATEKALQAFDAPIILLAGGKDEKNPFEVLSQYEDKCKSVFLFGETKHQLKEIFKKGILVDDLESAFKEAQKIATEGDVILLSPACASYDQFKNFEVRGDLFRKLSLGQILKVTSVN